MRSVLLESGKCPFDEPLPRRAASLGRRAAALRPESVTAPDLAPHCATIDAKVADAASLLGSQLFRSIQPDIKFHGTALPFQQTRSTFLPPPPGPPKGPWPGLGLAKEIERAAGGDAGGPRRPPKGCRYVDGCQRCASTCSRWPPIWHRRVGVPAMSRVNLLPLEAVECRRSTSRWMQAIERRFQRLPYNIDDDFGTESVVMAVEILSAQSRPSVAKVRP